MSVLETILEPSNAVSFFAGFILATAIYIILNLPKKCKHDYASTDEEWKYCPLCKAQVK